MADSPSADNPLDQLRLSLMQDVLPVGLAVLERARQGGPTKVAEVFSGASANPIADLREEGEPAARTVREQLDQVSPGLGNPVMPVSVSVEEPAPPPDERSELIDALQRIEGRLEELSRRLPADS